jgi:imidazole glycerol phosphate synthase glutamine amidotransferase subunit
MTPRRITAALVDYGAGNLASVARAFSGLGYRCRSSRDPSVLAAADLLVLPGVGAFPAAMAALHAHQLVDFLGQRALAGQPILGICLGMQLLADSSSEQGLTAGLGLVPGQVRPLPQARWHIGWNSVDVLGDDPLLRGSDGASLYFNHAYAYSAPGPDTVAVSRLDETQGEPITVAVHRQNIVGLQFHPEKSQGAGQQLLRNVVEGLLQ